MLFSIVAFNILFLYFVILITVLSWCIPPWVCSVWDSPHFLDFVNYLLQMLGKFSAIISSNIFLGHFSLS